MGKTGNHSVRFNQEKLALFQKLYPGITKPQQIVDELFNHFYYNHGPIWFTLNGKPTTLPAGTPVTVTIQPVTTKEFVEDFKNMEPVTLYREKYENYKKEILAAPSAKHVEAIAFIIKTDKDLEVHDKTVLQAFAVQHSRTFDF